MGLPMSLIASATAEGGGVFGFVCRVFDGFLFFYQRDLLLVQSVTSFWFSVGEPFQNDLLTSLRFWFHVFSFLCFPHKFWWVFGTFFSLHCRSKGRHNLDFFFSVA